MVERDHFPWPFCKAQEMSEELDQEAQIALTTSRMLKKGCLSVKV
jgi:hypothetical protein